MSLKYSLKRSGKELLNPTGTFSNKRAVLINSTRLLISVGGGPYHVSWQKQDLN